MRWGKRFLVFGVCYGTYRLVQSTGVLGEYDLDRLAAKGAEKIRSITGRA